MNLSDLTPNIKNPRKISDEKLQMLEASLKEFGDLSGFIFNRRLGRLEGGHQRQKVMPPDAEVVIEQKFDEPTATGTVALGKVLWNGEKYAYRVVEWDEPKSLAANIAANKHGGEWDLPALESIMLTLDENNYDLSLTGFGEEEIKDLFDWKDEPVEGLTDDDAIPETVETRCQPGQLWILGNHRLLCGDSTKIEDVERLMNGHIADITFTSPPYNLGDNAKLRGYNGDGDDSAYIDKSDHKTQEEYLNFLNSFTELAISYSKSVFVNIQILAGNKLCIPKYWMNFHDRLIDIMVWDKEHAPPQMAARVLNSVWEFIFIFTAEKEPKRTIKTGYEFRGTLDNIYRLNPIGKKDHLAKDHGAVFPVAFAEHFAEHFAEESVLDLFGGSGTTIIACEKRNRKCFTMEINSRYCDVIIQRWEQFTGKTATLQL